VPGTDLEHLRHADGRFAQIAEEAAARIQIASWIDSEAADD